jgi:hypothetical protein
VTPQGSTHVDTFTGTTSSDSRTATGKVAVAAAVHQQVFGILEILIVDVTTIVLLYCRAVLKPLIFILATGLVLAGCSDDSDDGSGLLGNGLLDALGRVRATADTRASVEYGEPAAVKALVDKVKDKDSAKDKLRYQTLQGVGYSSISMYSLTVKDKLGLDLDTFDSAIFVGKAPKQGTVLSGDYDVAAVDGKLSELGVDNASALGGTRWRAGDDYEINFEGPFSDTVPLSQLNDIVTREGTFAFAPAKEVVEWVTDPGDKTLADDDVLVGLAKCLGGVVAAQLQGTGEAVGVRQDGTQIICLKGDVDRVSDALKGDMPSGRPWKDVLPGAEAAEAEGLVQVTVPPQDSGPVGRVLAVMRNGDLAGLE